MGPYSSPSRILFLFAALTLAWASPIPVLAAQSFAHELSAQNEPSLNELEHGIENRLQRVEEFRFIQEEAAKLGVRAWLFGGTAAGYAHYVKWDLQREKGDPRYQPDRFDYDYTNIYRSTQDLDIVIDGDAEQAQKLQEALAQKYPHLQGSKTAWEVRLLTQDMGDKQAILNNPDFLNQHTDSNSTGLIEITHPPKGESVIRDARDWTSKKPHFLQDVHDGALHYYFSPLHETTSFAKEGRNPPILSAIRYLTKAFQYELKIRPEDMARIRQVILDFDPKAEFQSSYVAPWIEKNGKKLIQNAVDIEYAVNTLDQLGLREKLRNLKGDVDSVDSLAWWMNKEPLRTQPLGKSGKTAREIFSKKGWAKPGEPLTVAHETATFQAYESITRAHTGTPNVLISRETAAGEAALHGDGFYTRAGTQGARGSGLTIRFTLDPKARLGTDFELTDDYLIIKNKAAIRVIPETLNLSIPEYFEFLASGQKISHDDLALLEKLKRRMYAKAKAITPETETKLLSIVKAHLGNRTLFGEWAALPVSLRHPELVTDFIHWNPDAQWEPWLVKQVLSKPGWSEHPKIVADLIQHHLADLEIIDNLMTRPEWRQHTELVNRLFKETSTRNLPALAARVLTQPDSQAHPEWIQDLLDHSDSKIDSVLAESILRLPQWKDHPEFVKTLLARALEQTNETTLHDLPTLLAQNVLSRPYWSSRPELLQDALKIAEKNSAYVTELATNVFSQPGMERHPEMLARMLELAIERSRYDTQPARAIATRVLSQPQWQNHPEFVRKLIHEGATRSRNIAYAILEEMLTKPHWAKHPELIEELLRDSPLTQDSELRYAVATLLEKPQWRDHPSLRAITHGATPTLSNLKAAFDSGATLHAAPACAVSFQRLSGTSMQRRGEP